MSRRTSILLCASKERRRRVEEGREGRREERRRERDREKEERKENDAEGECVIPQRLTLMR